MTDNERIYPDADLLDRVAEIVSAYVSNNAVARADLPRLISETHQAMRSVSASPIEQAVAPAPTPAVPIKKSVTPDFIVCLDDGKKFKSLKRHLAQLGMTPDEYRTKWGLPKDYPMVAANYSATRSSLAKSSGLGRKPAAKPVVSAKRSKKAEADT